MSKTGDMVIDQMNDEYAALREKHHKLFGAMEVLQELLGEISAEIERYDEMMK